MRQFRIQTIIRPYFPDFDAAEITFEIQEYRWFKWRPYGATTLLNGEFITIDVSFEQLATAKSYLKSLKEIEYMK